MLQINYYIFIYNNEFSTESLQVNIILKIIILYRAPTGPLLENQQYFKKKKIHGKFLQQLQLKLSFR